MDAHLPQLFVTGDGSHSCFSAQYGVSYHSRYGAVTESKHVFIQAGLRYKAVVQRELDILEAGFGTGLNALLTWMEATRRNLEVRYTGLERFPLPLDTVRQLNYTDLEEDIQPLITLHTCAWEEPRTLSENFTFEKRGLDIETYEMPEAYDLIYYDAFAPQAQPALWTVDVLGRMFRSLRPDGVLVTYCAKGDVQRALKQVGFRIEKLTGPPGKREMVRALKDGS